MDQFAFIASHDLQASLNTISGIVDLMIEEVFFPPESNEEKYYTHSKNNTFRMKQMIQYLPDHSKIEENDKKFDEISLTEVCHSALEMIADQ